MHQLEQNLAIEQIHFLVEENAKKKFAEINDAPKYKQTIADCYKR